MIRHFLKLTWNRRRSNFLLVLEFFLAFIVLSLVILYGRTVFTHNQKAGGFRYDNVMYLVIPLYTNDKDSSEAKSDQIKLALKGIPEVEDISPNGVHPFDKDVTSRKISRGNVTVEAIDWQADEHYANVMSINLVAGRWFAQDEPDVREPVVLNSYLKEQLFGNESAIGKTVHLGNMDRLVIGVTGPFRPSSEEPLLPGFFRYQKSTGLHDTFIAYVKFKNTINAKAYRDIIEIKQRLVNKDDDYGIVMSVEGMHDREEKSGVTPLVIMSVVCFFLLINAAIGLFSVLWQNIRKRRSELGIRRAVGASSSQIYNQIIVEVVLLVTLGLIPGAILVSQMAMFRVVNLTPMVFLSTFISAALIVYVLVIICALYPGSLAAKVQPAEALHEE